MIKTILASVLVLSGFQAGATSSLTLTDTLAKIATAAPPNLNWKVGDSTDFNLSGGILSGTMHSFVREETAVGFWVQQDIDLGFLGKQKSEVLYDKTNGQVLELIVNGQKQDPPASGDVEVVETKQDRITVPKGTFDCMYAKVRDVKKNEEIQVWIAPGVPMGGMIKTIAPSQMGEVTLELTDFKI